MVTTVVAERGLASLSTKQLLDLYTGIAEVYGAALMWDDQELIERSQELLRELNEAFESKAR